MRIKSGRTHHETVTDAISMYRLVALNGPDPGWRTLIRDERVVLGRDPECRVHVDYPKVADRHLELCLQNGQVRMCVLKDAAPVTIRGESLTDSFLRHGDVLEFGDLHLQFQVIQPATFYPSRAPDPTRTAATVGVLLVLAIQLLIVFGLWLTGGKGGTPFVVAAVEEAPTIPDLSPFGLDARAEAVTIRFWEAIAEERFVEADEDLSELEAMVPDNEITVAARALMYEKQSRFDEAIALFNDAVARFPDSPHMALIESERARLEAAAAIAAAVEIAEHDATEIDAVLAQASDRTPAVWPAEAPTDGVADGALVEAAAPASRPDAAHESVPDAGPKSVPDAASGEEFPVASKVSGTSAADRVVASAAPEGIAAAPAVETVREPEPGPVAAAPPPESPPSRIRIASMQREKFLNRESYDEIRLIRIALSPRKSAGRLDSERLRVDVQFFDRDLESGAIERSAVPTPTKGLRVEGEWTDWENQSLSALYMVPRGFREREKEVGAGEKQFYGYIVQVYYDDVVQDEAAFPSSLID